MIKKLLLVRKNDVESDLPDKAGLTPFLKGKPLPVSPKVWAEESGLSHYAYPLELKLKDFEKLQKWVNDHPASTLLDVSSNADDALAGVGLRVHPSAE